MKICSIEGCESPVFSKGLCHFHSPKKKLNSSLQLTRGSMIKYKPKVGKYTQEDFDKLKSFYNSIWSKRQHYCENCKKWLGKEPLSYFFDHILEKSKYKELVFCEENIMLLCMECHDKKTRGFYSDFIKEKRELLETKYRNYN